MRPSQYSSACSLNERCGANTDLGEQFKRAPRFIKIDPAKCKV